MTLYSVEKDKDILFYLIEDTEQRFSKNVIFASKKDFQNYEFTPLEYTSLDASNVIVDIKRYMDDPLWYSLYGEFKFNRNPVEYFLRIESIKTIEILEFLESEKKGILNTSKRHIFLKILFGELLDLKLIDEGTVTTSDVPIIINDENLLDSVCNLLIARYGLDWKHGLNYPDIIQYKYNKRDKLARALYFATIGFDVSEYMAIILNNTIYYHEEKDIQEFKKENADVLKYFMPETYGVNTISILNSIYLSGSIRQEYDFIRMDENTLLLFIKRVLSDYYTKLITNKEKLLKYTYRNMYVPRFIMSKNEKNKLFKDVFMQFGYDEKIIDKIQKGKYTKEKFTTKQDVLKLMRKIVNMTGEWWQDCSLLPYDEIDCEHFCNWLKMNKPNSYYNASMMAKNEETDLNTTDLDMILAYATGGTAHMVPCEKGFKSVDAKIFKSISTEYKSRDEDVRQMELIAEYALTHEDSLIYLTEVFNEYLD